MDAQSRPHLCTRPAPPSRSPQVSLIWEENKDIGKNRVRGDDGATAPDGGPVRGTGTSLPRRGVKFCRKPNLPPADMRAQAEVEVFKKIESCLSASCTIRGEAEGEDKGMSTPESNTKCDVSSNT